VEDEIPSYELDGDTQNLLQTVLELALMSANLQLDPKQGQTVIDIVFQTAFRFGIELAVVPVNESTTNDSAGIDLTNLPFEIQVTFLDDPELQ